MSKYLKYHSCKNCFEYAHSLTNLTDKILFIHFKSLTVDSDSLFGSVIVTGSDFFQYIFQFDIFSLFLKNVGMLQENVEQKLKNKMFILFFFTHPYNDDFPN